MKIDNGYSMPLCVIPRSQHIVSRANISEAALKVLYKLKDAGFQSYLVGGGVRDLLLGREPKDFDVATDATPEQVREIFRNSRLIGRRFRLAHVYFGNEIVEVATFRGTGSDDGELKLKHPKNSARVVENGMIVRDNVYGTLEEDALRRDFTVNAMYYNIADFTVLDFANGWEDLRQGRLRLIGDPELRYQEDPVRMLRAVRFMCKLGFTLDAACEAPLWRLGHLLHSVSAARLFEEMLKLFLHGNGLNAFEKLRHYNLFRFLFPQTELSLAQEEQQFPRTLVHTGLAATDERVRAGKQVTPTFLLALLLWEPVRLRQMALELNGQPPLVAVYQAASEVLVRQHSHVAVPKRFGLQVREIWYLQQRFEARRGKRPLRLLTHPRFRAAFDFMLLRAAVGEVDQKIAEWWINLQSSHPYAQESMLYEDDDNKSPHQRMRRKVRKSAHDTQAE